MHVVLVLDHARINGGQAKVAIESGLGLRARGHEVTLFTAVGPPDPRLAEAGIEVVCLGQDDIRSTRNKAAFAVQAIWNAQAQRALGERLRRCDPERTIVHVHGWAQALSPSIGPALAESGLPLVYTMHEFFLVCPNGGFYDYPRGEVCHRRPLSAACLSCNCDSRSYPRKVLRVVRHLGLGGANGLRQAMRHVITISQLQEDVSRPYFPADTVFHRVDNPVSMPALGPKPEGPPGDFVYVGRLSPEKGVGLFAEAARRIGLRPVLVGDGPSADEIRGRHPEAVLLGWKNPDEVREVLRGARALVFPSVWYEGQPLTVYESLAAGTPVVVSDVCAGREAVADGETGFWFRSGDAADLAAKLQALSDDGLARRMARRAYERYWSAPLTLDRHLDRLTEVYAVVRQAYGVGRPAACAPRSPLPRAASGLAG